MKIITETVEVAPGVILPKPFPMDVKRFYMPGVTIEDNCQKCGELSVTQLGSTYLSYPDANAINEVHFYCQKCERDWYGKVLLKISVEAAPS